MPRIDGEAAALRRVMVMRPCGSRESTLARRIGAQRGLPVFHLDQAFRGPGWRPVPRPAFVAEVDRIASLPVWVVDGNSKGTLASRSAAAASVPGRRIVLRGRAEPDAFRRAALVRGP